MSATPSPRRDRRSIVSSAVPARDPGEQALAAALIELLASSPSAMARLVELLEDRGLIHTEPTTPVYTVASLAEALGVSPRWCAAPSRRGELAAVKRGGRWIIPAEAVRRVGAIAGGSRPSTRVRQSRTKSIVRSAPRSRSCRGRIRGAGGYDLL